jgi:hypothetical protein
MKEIVQNGHLDALDVIVNPKSALGKDIIQLETACMFVFVYYVFYYVVLDSLDVIC